MALSITTQLSSLYLSAGLPEDIYITVASEDDSVDVEVFVGGNSVFETTLFAYGYNTALSDIRAVIENAIKEDNNADADCYIVLTEGQDTITSSNFMVVMSELVIDNPSTFLLNNFLTTKKAFMVSNNAKQKLSWFSLQGETITAKIIAVIEDAQGRAMQSEWTQTAPTASTDGVLYYTVNVDDIIEHFEQYGTLKMFTVQRGSRTMDFYLTDESPEDTFLFLNAFNVSEYVEIYGSNTQKQKVERNEAICQRQHIFYDQILEQTNEVESTLLSFDDAEWLRQMLYSHYVAIQVDSAFKEILITESTLETSDDKNAQNKAKFTWKFARDIQYYNP